MNSDKENSMNKSDRYDSSGKVNNQQDKNQSDKNHPGYKSDTTKQGAGTGQPKFDKKSQFGDEQEEDIDSERRSEDQMPDPREFTRKDDRNYNDRSEKI